MMFRCLSGRLINILLTVTRYKPTTDLKRVVKWCVYNHMILIVVVFFVVVVFSLVS